MAILNKKERISAMRQINDSYDESDSWDDIFDVDSFTDIFDNLYDIAYKLKNCVINEEPGQLLDELKNCTTDLMGWIDQQDSHNL